MIGNSSNAGELIALEKEKKELIKILDTHLQEWEITSEIIETLENN